MVTALVSAPSKCALVVGGAPQTLSSLRSTTASPPSSLAFQRLTRRTSLVASTRTAGVRASAVDVSKIVPQADRILLRLDSLAEQSTGGVLLPKSAVKYDRYLVGEVLATGSEVEKIEKGNRVLVSDVNAYEVNLGTSEKLCFARASDLLAVVE
ncbi:unnamed protein product [Calypogeia fissa]